MLQVSILFNILLNLRFEDKISLQNSNDGFFSPLGGWVHDLEVLEHPYDRVRITTGYDLQATSAFCWYLFFTGFTPFLFSSAADWHLLFSHIPSDLFTSRDTASLTQVCQVTRVPNSFWLRSHTSGQLTQSGCFPDSLKGRRFFLSLSYLVNTLLPAC